MDEPSAIDPTANPDDGIKLDENGNPIDEKPSNIDEEKMADIMNIWSVFDNAGRVSTDELKTVMKALDVNVTDPDILEGIRQMIDPENEGFFTKEALLEVMEE